MATGITKTYWTDSSNIIPSESYSDGVEYEIKYTGKIPEEDILSSSNINEYEKIYGNGGNMLYYGDNLNALQYILHACGMRNKVKLIYIDPPYGTNSIFQTRDQKDSYRDVLIGSHYIEFMRRRLIIMKELLCDEGSIYVHLDSNMFSQIKILMDEIYGAKNFRGFITRKKCSNKNSTKRTYGNISDYILFYSKTNRFTWHRATAAWTEDKISKEYPCIDEKTNRRYKKVPIHAPGIRNGETGKEWKGMLPPKGKHWQYTPGKLDQLDANGDIYWSKNGNPRRKVFLDEDKGIPIQDIWLDVQDSLNQNIKITGYPTEKNPDLLKRIIEASSDKGDIVLDCFAGSGTTLDIASRSGRQWIGIDNSLEAIENILNRFLVGQKTMGSYASKDSLKRAQNSSLLEILEDNDINTKQSRADFNLYSDIRYSSKLLDVLKNTM